MICPPCAFVNHEECEGPGCTCQHQPLGYGLTETSLDEGIRALVTCEMGIGKSFYGLLNPAVSYEAHLVRVREGGGTPGPTLCGIEHFGKDAPGWSLSGGTTGPDVTHFCCPGCARVAFTKFPGLPIRGLGEIVTLFNDAIAALSNKG